MAVNFRKHVDNTDSRCHQSRPSNIIFVSGNVLCVVGGIAAIAVTGGAAAGPVLISGTGAALGIGAVVTRSGMILKNKSQQDQHTKNLGKALIKDLQCYNQFEEELSEVEEESFEYNLRLKILIRSFSGNGHTTLQNFTKKILPNLQNVSIQDAAGKKFLDEILKAAKKEEEQRQETQTHGLNAVNMVVRENPIPIKDAFINSLTEGTSKQFIDTPGGLAIGLGGLLLILNSIQFYNDQTAKSIGESIKNLADELSVLPPNIDEIHQNVTKIYQDSKKNCESELQIQLQNFEHLFDERFSEPEGKGVQNLQKDIEEMKAKYQQKELGPAKNDVYKNFEKTEVINIKIDFKNL
jgi:hypothetical protein